MITPSMSLTTAFNNLKTLGWQGHMPWTSNLTTNLTNEVGTLSDFGAAALAFKNANSLLVVPTNCTITEVVTLSSSNNLKCFPNPSTSSFTIQAKGNFNFVLMNMDGQLLETGSAIQETTVGESLSSGIYFLQISSGNEVEMMKIVKSN